MIWTSKPRQRIGSGPILKSSSANPKSSSARRREGDCGGGGGGPGKCWKHPVSTQISAE